MTEWLQTGLDVVSWILLTLGGLCVLTGGVGALRLPEFYTRIHAASLTDTAASLLIIAGLMLQSEFSLATFKLLAILAFMLLTGPTATYALVNAALVAGMRPDIAVPTRARQARPPEDDEENTP